jgi:ATP-binding cassette subfamily B protein
MKDIVRIFRFAGSLWRYYLGIGVFTVLLAAMSQLQPLFTKAAIDQITRTFNHQQVDIALVALYAILIFVTDVASTLFSNFGGYMGDILSAKLQQLMSQRYFEHLLTLPQRYFDIELSGKIINRMNRGINQITDFVQIVSNNFLQFIFSTIFSLLIVFYYSWQVGVMLTVLYPVFVWLTSRNSKTWQGYQKTINEELDIATGRFGEAVGQVRVVKSFLQEARELASFSKHFKKVVKTTRPQSHFWHKQDVIRRLVLNVIFFAIYIYIFIETARGRYTLGTMVLLIQYAASIRIPIFSISFIVDQTQRAIANTKDYFAVMDEQPEITDPAGATALKVPAGQVTFNDVSFGYEVDRPVLEAITFELEPGTKTALVGESGEGKTTITSLLLRLYEVSDGAISIDGHNIKDVTQASLRGHIGVVFQEPALFSGTIHENIAYARPGANRQEVVAAAKAANADEFIAKFKKGYESEIGERGLKLSGGQKQRIAIARALLKDAPILVLDEATSSLDSKSEHLVQEALERLMKHRTTLIIAHRLSTIQHVDKIITIQKGHVDEIGTPSELAKSGGIYEQLLNLQHGNSEANAKKLKEYELAG